MHLKNLKVMLVFSNEQVEVRHNATMHKWLGLKIGKQFEAAQLISGLKKGYNCLQSSLLIDFGKGNIGYAGSNYCH